MEMKFSGEARVTHMLTTKGIKFWKSWKWKKLTRRNEDTNKIGYDM